MAEVFKLPVKVGDNVIDMDFHCGTYATEKTIETLGISLSNIMGVLDSNFSSTIRHFIYFSAMDAQKLKTPKGEPLDFDHDIDDTYIWLDHWGGGSTPYIGIFTRKLLHSIYGVIAGEKMARILVDGETPERVLTEEKKSQEVSQSKKK